MTLDLHVRDQHGAWSSGSQVVCIAAWLVMGLVRLPADAPDSPTAVHEKGGGEL